MRVLYEISIGNEIYIFVANEPDENIIKSLFGLWFFSFTTDGCFVCISETEGETATSGKWKFMNGKLRSLGESCQKFSKPTIISYDKS